MAKRNESCSLCGRPAPQRQLCPMHYQRWRKFGDPTVTAYNRPQARFWDRVSQAGECWEWTAGVSAAGYGQFTTAGVKHYAHRFSYETMVGEIPEGLVIDHLFANKRCVNPEHLDPVPQSINARRYYASR